MLKLHLANFNGKINSLYGLEMQQGECPSSTNFSKRMLIWLKHRIASHRRNPISPLI